MDKLDAMTEQVRDFCDARDWCKYHTPKELAIGMATESSELLQLFRFMSDERIAEMFEDTEQRQAIEDEVADTLLLPSAFRRFKQNQSPSCALVQTHTQWRALPHQRIICRIQKGGPP